MEDSMVGAAEGYRELVADPAAQCARLRKSQMMGVRRPASAHEARLRCYELQVRPITIAARFAQRESAFVNVQRKGIVHTQFKPDASIRRSDFDTSGRG